MNVYQIIRISIKESLVGYDTYKTRVETLESYATMEEADIALEWHKKNDDDSRDYKYMINPISPYVSFEEYKEFQKSISY